MLRGTYTTYYIGKHAGGASGYRVVPLTIETKSGVVFHVSEVSLVDLSCAYMNAEEGRQNQRKTF